jgi:Spy/CpxP family protein refolding chaperone
MNRVVTAVTALGLLAGVLVPGARAETKGLGERAGLSREQKEKLKALRREHREEAAELRARLDKAMRLLEDRVKDGAAETELKAALDAAVKARRAAREARERHEERLAAALTPEQAARALLARERIKERFGRGRIARARGHGRGRGFSRPWSRD